MSDNSNSKSQSPSGAEPHNSYGLAPQSEQSSQKSQSSTETKPQAQSQSPSGAEPHDSYGLANPEQLDNKKGGSSSKDDSVKQPIADDPVYNQPKGSSSSGEKSKL